MEKLIQKIEKAIEKKAMETGKMGTESVYVTIELTEEEKKIFQNIDNYDDPHYWWEFDGLSLNISYTEEFNENIIPGFETLERIAKFYGVEVFELFI